MAQSTYDDANLMMQLITWGQQSGLLDSMRAIFQDDFDVEKAPDDDEHVSRILFYFEVTGTFVKQGVLNAGLVYDMWTVAALWKKVEPVALRGREQSGEPRLWENFELLAANQPV